ncbi:MAG TPA: IPT/TIG domain-containing protein, partial [Solirubrobacteraceae bacterium]
KWTPLVALSDEEASSFGHFGRSVALSADATTALVGGPGDNGFTGAAWGFTRSGGAWKQQPGKLLGEGAAAGARFGKSVALSADGTTALVGAENAEGGRGGAWTFVRGEAGFVQQGGELAPTGKEVEEEAISGTGGHFGASLALSGDGGKALIGAPRAYRGIGTVTQLKREAATWDRLAEGLAGSAGQGKGWRGSSVALSSDGFVAAIGAPRDHGGQGAAWVFAEEPPAAIPPPAVTKVVPGHGPTGGGTEVTISGGNFNEATEVHFGATAATSFGVSNATEIVAVTPPGSPGKVDVTVTTPKGTSATSAKDSFVYEEPGEEGHEGEKEKGGEEGTQETPGKPNDAGKAGASGGVGAFIASAGDCRVSLAKKRLAVTRYRSVALRLNRTGSGACRGSVALSYKVKAKGRGFALRTLGAASFSISGTTSVVTVKLSKAGQRWLRAHHGKGNASLAIARVTPAPTLAVTASVRLSLKKTPKATPVKP